MMNREVSKIKERIEYLKECREKCEGNTSRAKYNFAIGELQNILQEFECKHEWYLYSKEPKGAKICYKCGLTSGIVILKNENEFQTIKKKTRRSNQRV